MTTTVSCMIDPTLARQLATAAKNTRKWHQERDNLIREAYEAGAGVREIARLVNLSHPGVLAILKAEPK